MQPIVPAADKTQGASRGVPATSANVLGFWQERSDVHRG
jgi:hypothetical protein